MKCVGGRVRSSPKTRQRPQSMSGFRQAAGQFHQRSRGLENLAHGSFNAPFLPPLLNNVTSIFLSKSNQGSLQMPVGRGCHRNSSSIHSIRVPNGAMSCVRTVFGSSPEPQIMNEPKSLYQSPSGAQGPAFTQSCNRRRSWSEIRRSSTRARMCSQTGRGRLENRIFGNRVCPENCPDQILPRFVFSLGVGFRHETAIRCIEILACCQFSFHSALREHNQGAAHRQMFLLCHTLDLNCQLGRHGDALANRWRCSYAGP
jgi:hypothetical protein